MGALDQFAKRTFALDTPVITGGAIAWEGSAEVGLTEVRLDGLLTVKAPEKLLALPAPWCDAVRYEDVVVEVKMQGDHLAPISFLRAELRRAAWHVCRAEKEGSAWEGHVGLWLIASHVPAVLRKMRHLHSVAPGCYAVDYPESRFLWVAANELPLDAALLPFLVARSGKALAELGHWMMDEQMGERLLAMLESLPMKDDNFLARFAALGPWPYEPTPEFTAFFAKQWPHLVPNPAFQDALSQARLDEARKSLRVVMGRRGLSVSAEQEARIDACKDLAELERWLVQAITARTSDEALA